MIPGCISASRSAQNSTDDITKQTKSIVQIYIDWANHYLEKARSKRRINSLVIDCRDGVLLAEIIECVTGQKIQDINKKPKTSSQMLQNINLCLNALQDQNVSGIENIPPQELLDGKLKPILSVFFALSKHKQVAKQAAGLQQHNERIKQPSEDAQASNRSPLNHHYNKAGNTANISSPAGSSSIPLPDSAPAGPTGTTKRCHIPTASPSLSSADKSQTSGSSRTSSPTMSMIPRGHPASATATVGGQHYPHHPSAYPHSNYHQQQANAMATEHHHHQQPPQQKHSMLTKLKLFNGTQNQKSPHQPDDSKPHAQFQPGGGGAISKAKDGGRSTSSATTAHRTIPNTSGTNTTRNTLSSTQANSAAAQRNKVPSSKSQFQQQEASNCTTLSKATTKIQHQINNTSHNPSIGRKPSHVGDHKAARQTSSPAQAQRSLSPNTNLTGIPKPVATVKGTISKPSTPAANSADNNEKTTAMTSAANTLKRENSHITQQQQRTKPLVVLVQPMKNKKPAAAANNTPAAMASNATVTSQSSQQENNASSTCAQPQPSDISSNNVANIEANITLCQTERVDEPAGSNIRSGMQPQSTDVDDDVTVSCQPSLKQDGGNGRSMMTSPTDKNQSTNQVVDTTNDKPTSINSSSCKDVLLVVPKNQPNSMTAQYSTENPEHDNSRLYSLEQPSLFPKLNEDNNSSHGVVKIGSCANKYQQHNNKTYGTTNATFLKSNELMGPTAPPNGMLVTTSTTTGLNNGYMSDGEILRISSNTAKGDSLMFPRNNHHQSQMDNAIKECGGIPDGYASEGGGGGMVFCPNKNLLLSQQHQSQVNNGNRRLRSNSTFTVLTEQISRRGRCEEPPPPPAPASGHPQHSGSSSRINTSSSSSSSSRSPRRNNASSSNSNAQTTNANVGSGSTHIVHQEISASNKHGGGGGGGSSNNGGHQSSSWKRYTDSPGVGSPPPPPAPGHISDRVPSSPTSIRKERRNNSNSATSTSSAHHHNLGGGGGGGNTNTSNNGGGGSNNRQQEKISSSSSSGSSSGRVKGIPQSFGYVKKNAGSGCANGTISNGSIPQQQPNPGHQSEKTTSSASGPRTKVKVSGGTQTYSTDLQQTFKSNPGQFKSFSLSGNAASQLSQSVRERLMMGSQSLPKNCSQEYGLILRQSRPKTSDGSLSDTQAVVENMNPYAPWLRHSNTYSIAPRLSETDSMESLTSLPSHRSSLTNARLMRDSPSRLSRSNSIRSTKSEKLYPSMLHRNVEPENEPYYCLPVGALNHWSQPASPAPGSNRNFPLSPTHSSVCRSNMSKNDEVHGSSISLISTTSSLYSSAEEKQAHEIRKLRRELNEAQDKVQTLTSQLSTNAHVVSAFEQSLTSMTQRLQHLTATAEKKDTELSELKTAMEALRAQSVQAGITTGNLARQASSDSVSSLSSACSLDKHDKKKKKGWLRSSFTKAFSRNAKVTKVHCSQSESESSDHHHQQQRSPYGHNTNHSPTTASPSSHSSHTPHHHHHSHSHGRSHLQNMNSSNSSNSNSQISNMVQQQQHHIDHGQEVAELQKQLREKDLVLTDIRLEALSSAHQLESLRDTVMKMRSEMLSLKQNNERLQRMVGSSSNFSSTSEMRDAQSEHSMDAALSDLMSTTTTTEEPPSEMELDGKEITISVYLGQPQSFKRYYSEHYSYDGTGNAFTEIAIARIHIGSSTTWSQLDQTVRRTFKQHLMRLDPGGCLGLGSDSVASYKLGEAERKPDADQPDLLPIGYSIGRVCTLHIVLQPIAALAFEALIPKGVAQRLVSLLAEHKRLVLCGAPGTGKTHLATRLAEFHVQSQGRDPAEAVATFSVDNKSNKELRQYLAHLSEQAATGDNSVLPCVVVLDNLHKAGPLSDALGSLPRNLPCLVGTMAQSACSATSLQLQHGFRWVLVAPHMEPARGLLGRVLRRRLATLELERGPQPELAAILGWLPRIWQHLNAFLETHSSGDVVIGPRLFLSCPLEIDAARAWFADIWNYSLAPYLREAVREGLQLYGRRAPWIDPCQFILDTYPWPGAPPQGLTQISAKDVGLPSSDGTCSGGNVGSHQQHADGDGDGGCSSDPLLNMLMRLQEAANYNSSPHQSMSSANDDVLTNDSLSGSECNNTGSLKRHHHGHQENSGRGNSNGSGASQERVS